jgi:hypothetical protein
MTTLLPGQDLGFLPIHGREWGRGEPDTLQEGKVAPAGVTASVSGQANRDFSQPPKNHSRTIRKAPPNLPSTNMRHRGFEVTINVSPWQTLRCQMNREEPALDK